MLLRMEMRWAERRGMKVELKEVSPGEEAGIKSASFIGRGENAYGLFSAEKGVHRLVRISPFDSQSRRHTAFAGVEVAPLVEDSVDVEIEPDDIQIDTYRASGAGGQHVNKTDSAVRITHRPSGIVVQCQNERSQSSNCDTAMKMLRAKLIELEERRRQEALAKERARPRTSAGARRSAATSCTRTRWSRTTARTSRRQRPGRARRRPRRVRAAGRCGARGNAARRRIGRAGPAVARAGGDDRMYRARPSPAFDRELVSAGLRALSEAHGYRPLLQADRRDGHPPGPRRSAPPSSRPPLATPPWTPSSARAAATAPVRMLPLLDLERTAAGGKPLIGMSDITHLLVPLAAARRHVFGGRCW